PLVSPVLHSFPTRRSSDLLGLQAIRLGVPIDDELHRFGFDEVGVLFRFLPRAGRDLLGGLPRGLKETVDLLPRLVEGVPDRRRRDRKSTRLNSSHGSISYA